MWYNNYHNHKYEHKFNIMICNDNCHITRFAISFAVTFHWRNLIEMPLTKCCLLLQTSTLSSSTMAKEDKTMINSL